ncbi:hypothetical protein HN51_020296 [Arachis hypogaea]|uniref:SUN domain-containing protein n=2 Tax=Arachis TaxID=3817 RepID=A0A445C046_ARAHY|nr:SUN domain-containing protein 4 [Arachis duranensis]XP_025615481.1 SUN domain-containing protein 4 [Arachis hypogaea]QHO32215.1 uncharacterized protein DS421_8g247950 [Arachis hypogaea]RYR44384.1 hypothetical protein Ahy_A08g040721 [Arachis hypogaea]
MQRTRKALLLERRAFGLEKPNKNNTDGSKQQQLYKVSISLVFVLWGLILLFSLWISGGHGYSEHPLGVSNWNEDKHGQCKISHSAFDFFIKANDAYISSEAIHGVESLPNEESRDFAVTDPINKETSHSPAREEPVLESHQSAAKLEENLTWDVPLGLDEFKSRAISSKTKSGGSPSVSVIHRVEPGGAEYNYASAAKGAKVLASNKEAKGASNILSRDKDKYLRNPCSAEEKFVVIELSEETLVDTIEIANFEHHSSNLKAFELHGSLVYPTDDWVFLGNFTASNVKHAQTFVLQEPKWVRYLKLNLQSHYGSEFYCTLSVVEVYGVDAVERMLEDLIYTQDNLFASGEGNGDKKTVSLHPNPAESENIQQNASEGIYSDPASDISSASHGTVNSNVPDPVDEIRQQVGRMPGDTVLKILMQKVRSLDLNLSVLERYLKDLNSRYINIFKDYRKEIEEKDILLQKFKEDVRELLEQQDILIKEASYLNTWKSHISIQMDHLLKDNAALRSEVEKVREKQASLENKGVVVFFICCIFAMVAILRLALDMTASVYRVLSVNRTLHSMKFCNGRYPWYLLLFSCSVIIFILTL